MLVISHEIPHWPKWIGRLSEGANWHPQGAWRPLRCYCITPLRNNDLNQSEIIIIIFATYNYNQGKGNNDPSQLEFHQTRATGLLEKMSVFTRLSKEPKEFGQNNYSVKVKGFPILMTVKCHLNWKTLTKRPYHEKGKVFLFPSLVIVCHHLLGIQLDTRYYLKSLHHPLTAFSQW